MKYINETSWRTDVKNIDKTEMYLNGMNNQTVSDSYCFYEGSSARKAVVVTSLVIMLFIIFLISCLYARILRILFTKLNISHKSIRRPRIDVLGLTASQQTELGIESPSQRHDTNIVNENVKFGDVCNQLSRQDQQNAVIKTTNAKKSIQRQKAKVKFIVMFLIIVIFYGVSYIPSHVIVILEDIDQQNTSREDVKRNDENVLLLFGFINHIINPFIYGCFDSTFREKYKEIFYRNRCK